MPMKDMRAQGYDNGPYMEGMYKVFEAEKLDKQVINQIIRDLGHLQNNWDSLIQETRLVCTEMNIEHLSMHMTSVLFKWFDRHK